MESELMVLQHSVSDVQTQTLKLILNIQLKTHKEDFETILLCNYAEQNKTLYWKASDTENKFKTKLKEKPEAVSYWKDKSIEYRYNNYGFRTYDDFNKDDEGIVCLGCSFTEGIGLPLEYNWLEGEYDNEVSPKAIHFTNGGPWHKYWNGDYKQKWINIYIYL